MSDIAIIGMSFKMPQEAEHEAGFWEMLAHRRNAMTVWPASRVNLESFYEEDGQNANMVRNLKS